MTDSHNTTPIPDPQPSPIPASHASASQSAPKQTKHKLLFEYLHNNIRTGTYKPGYRLPSEAELGAMFGVSRITVAKAVAELQRMKLVTRRPGAGTHVQTGQPAESHTFGLLIPELGMTEIFEPVCHGMMRSPFARPGALLWGNASGTRSADSAADPGAEAEHLAHFFISQNVSGVFFAPLELIPARDSVNRRIIRSLDRAHIPTVLLDRNYLPYPERSAHDLVGSDNRAIGYLATNHLIELGVSDLVFFAGPNMTSAIEARIAGFHEALCRHNLYPSAESIWKGDPQDRSLLEDLLRQSKPGGMVCANDEVAAQLMHSLLALGIRIPEDIRMVGIDDVKYAGLLPVPLTTVRQNCTAIGIIAMATMLERLKHPELPTRDIHIAARLVVRRSCGAHLNTK